MAIKIKAVERKLKFDKSGEGEYRYVMQPELYSALDQEKVIRETALRSGVSQGVMQACWDAAGEVIKAWATEGHSVALPGLGTMRFGLSAQSVADVSKVKSELIKTRRIIFTPNTALKQELAQTAVMITCYDRNGDIVRRVTTTSGEVVTEDDANTNNTQGSTGSDSSSENGSQTGGDSNTDSGSETGAGSETGGNGGLG